MATLSRTERTKQEKKINIMRWSDSRTAALRCILCCMLMCWMRSTSAKSVSVTELEKNWTLVNRNESISLRGLRVPSGVYSAYCGEDVLQSYNDVGLRWLAYDNFTYGLAISLNRSDLMSGHFVNLTFHGVDTVAEIRLNHNLLGRTDNMFVRYSYDVTHLLQDDNLLEVELTSPVWAALDRAHRLEAQNKTVPPFCPPDRYHGECHANFLRKMQASFAWDWGLAAPSMGIWKAVALEYYEVALIRDVDVAVAKNDSHWTMHISVYMDAAGGRDFYAELKFFAVELLKDPVIISKHRTQPIKHQTPVIRFQVAIPIEDVVTWWPNGFGDQKLYPLHFTLNAWPDRQGPGVRARTISRKSLSVGFRTIELVEDPVPEGTGNTFYFKVNGQAIFMKGSNYIPSHILPELGNDMERIKHLLVSARDAHMNMLRVWGGGIYESDYFYSLADQYGILIWQDMMFACAMYPATEEFLASVRAEVSQNAKRISYHPSVAIFATNNENELALMQDWYGTWREQPRFEAEYRELYLGTVMHELKIVEHSTRPRPLISSPSNGKESAKDNFLSKNPDDPDYGDVHFYDIRKDAWDPTIYPRPRFASEYGFQSLPSMQSWRRAMAPGDDLISLVQHRQHHPLAMWPITLLISWHFHLPLPEEDKFAEALVYYSQISQAMAIKVETELYRTLRDSEARTMGALYWQLNDVWVAPSWSSIDFYGNYKLLHYWAKDFLAPIAISALHDSNMEAIGTALICDHFEVSTDDLYVTMNVYLWSELFPRNSTTWPAFLRPNGVVYDKVIPLKNIFGKELTAANSFLEFTLRRNNTVLSRTHYFPSPFHAITGVRDPELELEISTKKCIGGNSKILNSFSLTITIKSPAIFVDIEIMKPYKYRLSQNGFMQTTPVQMVHLELEHTECVVLKPEDIKVLTVNQFLK